MEITNVSMLGEDYVINNSVKISNINFSEDGNVVYDLDYNHNEMTEESAVSLCEVFINKAIEAAIEGAETDNNVI